MRSCVGAWGFVGERGYGDWGRRHGCMRWPHPRVSHSVDENLASYI
jgi:hypothetical protein